MKNKIGLLILTFLAVLVLAAPGWSATANVTRSPSVINFTDSNLRVEVPRDTSTNNYKIEGNPSDYSKITPVDAFYITKSVDLKIDNNTGNLYLTKPVRLVFTFDLIDFKRASNLQTWQSTAHYRIGKWDEDKQNWTLLNTTVYWDGSNGEVEADAYNSGRYALLWAYQDSEGLSNIGDGTIRIMVDLTPVASDVAPYVKYDRTMIPLRVISEKLGIDVTWVDKEQRIDLLKRNTGDKVQLWIDKTQAMKNDDALTLDVAPEITGGRTFVPLRFVAEVFGAKVEWDETSMTAKVFSF